MRSSMISSSSRPIERDLTELTRGAAHLCRRADVTHSVGERRTVRPSESLSPTVAFQTPTAPGRQEVDAPINERILSLVTTLAERVKNLETKLDGSGPRKRPADGAFNELLISSADRPLKQTRISQPEASQADVTVREDELMHAETDSNSRRNSDAEAEDAATVLEFLAWGRLKDINLTNDLRDPSGPHDLVSYPEKDIIQTTQAWVLPPSSVSASHMTMETWQISQIQEMLPDKEQVVLLFEYHADWLLWMHCSFHVQTFRRELEQFYNTDSGIIIRTSSGLQWAALLLAIICGSMTCAKPTQVASWGFTQGM